MASGKLIASSSFVSRPAVSVVEVRPRAGWTDPWAALAEELLASGREDQAAEVVRQAARLAPHDQRVQGLRDRLAGPSV